VWASIKNFTLIVLCRFEYIGASGALCFRGFFVFLHEGIFGAPISCSASLVISASELRRT
jgi:hypothetical protein